MAAVVVVVTHVCVRLEGVQGEGGGIVVAPAQTPTSLCSERGSPKVKVTRLRLVTSGTRAERTGPGALTGQPPRPVHWML